MRPNFLKTIERKHKKEIDMTLTVISIMILCVAVLICLQ